MASRHMAAVVDKRERNQAQPEYWPLARRVRCLWWPYVPRHSALELVMDRYINVDFLESRLTRYLSQALSDDDRTENSQAISRDLAAHNYGVKKGVHSSMNPEC